MVAYYFDVYLARHYFHWTWKPKHEMEKLANENKVEKLVADREADNLVTEIGNIVISYTGSVSQPFLPHGTLGQVYQYLAAHLDA